MITPNIPMPRMKTAIEQVLIVELRNSVSGISGSAAFVSEYRNTASITAENANSDSTRVAPQP